MPAFCFRVLLGYKRQTMSSPAKEAALLTGNTKEFVSPSKLRILIREQNGEDEDIISKQSNLIKGDAIHFFLAGIVLKVNDQKITSKEIENWRVRDKYYTLLKSRIFSLGADLNYRHRCSNPNCSKPEGQEDPLFEEDLNQYDRDFSDTAPADTRDEFKYRIEPYISDGTHREFKLSSGKEVRYKYLTGVEEKKVLQKDRNSLSKNSDIALRELEWKNEQDQWQKITHFGIFSSREMAQIRKDIEKHDMPWEAISETTCPYCNHVDYISLLAQPDFFFPGEAE